MGTSSVTGRAKAPWLSALRNYLLFAGAGHLAWEFLQLPLYAVFWTSGTQNILFAVAHCTGGDLLITIVIIVAALVFAGDASWPGARRAYLRVAGISIAMGAAYTVFSEWLNVSVRQSWAYTPMMPTLPPLGTGLAPLAQWLVVPALAFWFAWRAARQAAASAMPPVREERSR